MRRGDPVTGLGEAILGGLIAGYAIAIPVGAIGVLIVSLAARTSLPVGIGAALGVATADGVFAGLAVLGGAALAGVIAPIAGPLRWIAVAVLLGLAGRTAFTAIRQRGGAVPARTVDGPMARPVGAYLALLGLTLLNPATVIYFVALVLGRQSTEGTAAGAAHETVWVLAVFVASASWQVLLAGGGALLGRLLTSDRGRFVTAIVSSLVLAALAVSLLR